MRRNQFASFSFRDVFRTLERHKGKAIGVFAGVMLLAIAAILLWQRTYRSEGKLFVRIGRESVTLDPTATTGQTISVSESREIEINSIVEMLDSRAMAERVVDTLGPDIILGKARAASSPIALDDKSKDRQRQSAVGRVDRALTVTAPEKTTVITVRCDIDSPELAQRVVATLLDVYLEDHARVHRPEGSHEFFLKQAKLFEDELRSAERELRDAKNEYVITTIEGQRLTLQTQIGAIQGQIVTTEAGLSAAAARAAALQITVDRLPERMVTQDVSGVPGVGAEGMQQELFRLQLRERELLAKFTEDHPEVIAIRGEVEQAKQLHALHDPLRTQSTTAVNPSRQQLELALLTEQANVESLAAQRDELNEQLALAHQQLRQLNDNELRVDELERRVTLASDNFQTYSEKLEQTRIDQALENQRISNVSVWQPANHLSDPVSPSKTLILALGLIIATFGAYGTAMLAEQWDRSLKTPEEVERQLEVPVLVSIPRYTHEEALLN